MASLTTAENLPPVSLTPVVKTLIEIYTESDAGGNYPPVSTMSVINLPPVSTSPSSNKI
jgi:hypothetical protein